MKNARTLFIIQPYSKVVTVLYLCYADTDGNDFTLLGITEKQTAFKHKILKIIDLAGLL